MKDKDSIEEKIKELKTKLTTVKKFKPHCMPSFQNRKTRIKILNSQIKTLKWILNN